MPKYVNVNGVWKQEGAGYVNVGGVWKAKSDEYVNVGGVWKPLLQSGDTVETFSITHDSNLNITNAFVVANKYLYMVSDSNALSGFAKLDLSTKKIIQTVTLDETNSTTTWSASETSSTDAILVSDRYNRYMKRWLNGSLQWTKSSSVYNQGYRAYVANDGTDYIGAVYYQDEDEDLYKFKIFDSSGNETASVSSSNPRCTRMGVDANGRIVFADYYTVVYLNKSGGYTDGDSIWRNGQESGGIGDYLPLSNGVDVFIGYTYDGRYGIGYCLKNDFANRDYFTSYSYISGTYRIHRAIGNDIIVSFYKSKTITLYRMTITNSNGTAAGIKLTVKYQKTFSNSMCAGVGSEYAYIVSTGTGTRTITKVKL